MDIDNSDYLDPDGFTGDNHWRETVQTYPLTLHLTCPQMTRLSITLISQAQQYEFQARNRESKAAVNGVSRAPGVLTMQLRERADDARALVNAYREAAGLGEMDADDILNW